MQLPQYDVDTAFFMRDYFLWRQENSLFSFVYNFGFHLIHGFPTGGPRGQFEK